MKRLDERNKRVIFKNFAPFTDFMSEINNAQIDNAKDLDVVMPMHNLSGYNNNYSKRPRRLWQYYRGGLNDILTNSESFKYKIQIKNPAPGNTKDVKIAVPVNSLKVVSATFLLFCF